MKPIVVSEYGGEPRPTCICAVLPARNRPCPACRSDEEEAREHVADPEAIVIHDNDGGPDGDE